MLERLWAGASSTVLVISQNDDEHGVDGAFLHRPPIKLLTGRHDHDSLRLARRRRPSLIIDDIEDAPVAAIDFCRSLHEDPATRGIPLVVVASSELDESARACDATLVLTHPVGRYELFRAVRRFVPMPARRSSRFEVNLRFSYRSPTLSGQAFSRDLSLDGAFLHTDRVPALDERFELTFRLPGDLRLLRCTGTVVRVSEPGCRFASSEPGFAVQFNEIDDEGTARLERFVEQLDGRGASSR